MYAYIEGILAEKSSDSIVIDANGVGYLLVVSNQTLAAAPAAGDRIKLYTYFSVREDSMELFGFSTKEEKAMFLRLRGVSGVGSRTALGLLSALNLRDLTLALLAGDAAALSRAPGIGKKTAQRLVLELKDKIDDSELTGDSAAYAQATKAGPEGEAVAALISLGYASSEAARAVSRVAGKTDKADELIFLALRSMGE